MGVCRFRFHRARSPVRSGHVASVLPGRRAPLRAHPYVVDGGAGRDPVRVPRYAARPVARRALAGLTLSAPRAGRSINLQGKRYSCFRSGQAKTQRWECDVRHIPGHPTGAHPRVYLRVAVPPPVLPEFHPKYLRLQPSPGLTCTDTCSQGWEWGRVSTPLPEFQASTHLWRRLEVAHIQNRVLAPDWMLRGSGGWRSVRAPQLRPGYPPRPVDASLGGQGLRLRTRITTRGCPYSRSPWLGAGKVRDGHRWVALALGGRPARPAGLPNLGNRGVALEQSGPAGLLPVQASHPTSKKAP